MTASGDQALTSEEQQTLEAILTKLSGRGANLPGPLFRFITEVTPTANVDLLVRDNEKGLLLAWREDPFGVGWHVPGSIIRHREEIAHRLSACAHDEFGCEVDVVDRPIAIIQIFDDRGHSVSLCYRAALLGIPSKRVVSAGDTPNAGDLSWFVKPPAQLYPSHLVYREVFEALDNGQLGEGIPLFTEHVGQRDAAQASPEGAIASASIIS
jgi:ADP-ribose pyrophosphatase YjhB (NUDIX family)